MLIHLHLLFFCLKKSLLLLERIPANEWKKQQSTKRETNEIQKAFTTYVIETYVFFYLSLPIKDKPYCFFTRQFQTIAITTVCKPTSIKRFIAIDQFIYTPNKSYTPVCSLRLKHLQTDSLNYIFRLVFLPSSDAWFGQAQSDSAMLYFI